MLLPQQNTHRSLTDLGGYWRFLPDPADTGETAGWPERGLPSDAALIAVPGSWNEQLAERGLLNYVGAAWYETDVTLPPPGGQQHDVWLRVGAADHRADVWVNGIPVGSHQGGFVPFELLVTQALHDDGGVNRLTIRVDSRLTLETIPQGIDPSSPLYCGPEYARRHVYPPTRFDFFPYGGLTRSVVLVATGRTHLTRLQVRSAPDGSVTARCAVRGEAQRCQLRILDAARTPVGDSAEGPVQDGSCQLHAAIPHPRLWCPADPYLYSAQITVLNADGERCDLYEERFGVREIRWDGGALLLNGQPLYLTGFGKHEEFPIVGRGQFRPAYVRDFELLRWTGANSFRTSHYPYDEEILSLADRLGFLVIDEVPAVSLGFWTDSFAKLSGLLDNHMKSLTELIERDQNHPSVISWSIVNEPNLWSEPYYQNDAARQYFAAVSAHVRSLDPTRPVMAITIPAYSADDVALGACDVIGINRYFAWYTDPADISGACAQLDAELDRIFRTHGKPIVVTEFGVDTVDGLHATTPQLFTEEYQVAFLMAYAKVIDAKPFCAGTHVWNFADFLTPQHFRRVIFNRKGVFTRSREPKAAAFALREYWHAHARVHPSHRPAGGPRGFLIDDMKPAR